MRKKIIGGLLVVAIAAVAAFNMSMNTQESEMSALALANVEALAENEASITCHQYAQPGRMNKCWKTSITWEHCVRTGIPYEYCYWGI